MHTWNIFILFDSPTEFKQIKIDSNNPSLPKYDVKSLGVRHAIIAFNSDLVNMTLNFEPMNE